MRYIVFRNGWNAANQSASSGCPLRMAVAEVEAPTAEEACRLAGKRVSCYANQHFDAEAADAVEAADAAIDAAVKPLERGGM